MKWIIEYTFLATLTALTVFGQTSSTTTSSSTVVSPTPESPIESCIKQQNCAPGDVACRAKCAQVPNPNASMVNSTNNCVAQCDQSNAAVYAQCKSNCINMYYGPNPTGNGSGNGSTNSSGGNGSTNGSGNNTGTNGNNGTNKPNSASYVVISTAAFICTISAAILHL